MGRGISYTAVFKLVLYSSLKINGDKECILPIMLRYTLHLLG